jgi:outer membrane protein OmpA-like peptidoglycan-associated protein
MTTTLAYGQSKADKVKIKGLITQRTGDSLVVKTFDGANVAVVLTDDTKVQKPKGLGLRRTQMSAAILIPGLKVEVNGTGDAQTKVVANSINYSQDDLETAETIQAGLTPTQHAVKANQQNIQANKENIQTNAQGVSANQAQAAANKQQIAANQKQIEANQQEIADTTKRFSNLIDYEVKGNTKVNFTVGSSAVSAQAQAALTALAHDAVNLKGYIVQVKGFADSSGSAAMNQRLSMDRADAVIAYLIQNCNVPVRHIVAPGAMGEANPTASNETTQGRAENRRVEVTVLVNKGLAGE